MHLSKVVSFNIPLIFRSRILFKFDKIFIMKKLAVFISLFFVLLVYAQGVEGLNIEGFRSSGSYQRNTDKIYVDKSLKQTTKSTAVYYLQKELIGRELAYNDRDTGNYWEDRAYFKDTPIIRYVYKYFDVRDNKLVFAASASEFEGQPHYIFHGMAFTANKNDKVKHKVNYQYGKLHGELAEYNSDGSFKNRKLYKNGQLTQFRQSPASLNEAFYGKWEATIPSSEDWTETDLINIYKEDGTIEAYNNMYYKNGSERRQTMDGSDTSVTGYWIYQPKSADSGIVEYYMDGELLQKNEVVFPDSNTMKIIVVYYNKNFGKSSFTELTFKRIN